MNSLIGMPEQASGPDDARIERALLGIDGRPVAPMDETDE